MWDELGIAPCADPKAIRRAYAARLKKLDPDRDPEAFARLRDAFEWALGSAREEGEERASQPAHGRLDDAEPAGDGSPAGPRSEPEPEPEPEPNHGEPIAEQSPPPADRVRKLAPQPTAKPSDHDEIRDRALLIALDAALRRRDASEAIVLYYRASATGALSLERAPDMIVRVLAIAVDDMTLDAAAFRDLVRTAGLDASRSRTVVGIELRQRVLARLAAQDWYDDLLATAKQRRGKVARRRAKIARLMLGRIGRHWHPRVDKTALKSWLAQYRTHSVWLEDRIDPAWVKKLERRLRRREIFWLGFYGLFIGGLLIQSVLVFTIGLIDGDVQFWVFMGGLPLIAFLFWIFTLLLKELRKLLIPGWAGFAGIAPLRRARALWAGRSRAIWNRWKAKGHGDAS
jgi:hypothetical protein